MSDASLKARTKAWIAKIRSQIAGTESRATGVGFFAAVVILAAGFYIASWFVPAPVPQARVYFYDIGTQSVFTADMANIPPILAPSQIGKAGAKPMGVRAAVYSCGDCAKADQRFVAYVEAYSTEAHTVLVERSKGPGIGYDMGPNERRNDPSVAGLLVSLPDGKNWVSVRDEAESAGAIMDSPKKRCGNEAINRCYPTAE